MMVENWEGMDNDKPCQMERKEDKINCKELKCIKTRF